MTATFARRYLKWWAPVLAPTAFRLLDLAEESLGHRAGSVIDVGTGTGTLVMASAARWSRAIVVGLDPDLDMLSVAATQVRGSDGTRSRAAFVAGRAEALPFHDSWADVVLSSFAFQHVDRSAALREAARVLRPGGVVAIVTWLGPRPFYAPREAFSETLRELGLVTPDRSRSPRNVGGLESASAAVAEFEAAGVVALQVNEMQLGYRFEPDTFLGWKEHLDERELFEHLESRERERLVERIRDRLSTLHPADFVVPDPVLYIAGVA